MNFYFLIVLMVSSSLFTFVASGNSERNQATKVVDISERFDWVLRKNFDTSETEKGIWPPNYLKEKIKGNTYTIVGYRKKTENMMANEQFKFDFKLNGRKSKDKNTSKSPDGMKVFSTYESRYNPKTKKAWLRQNYKVKGGNWSVKNLKDGQTLTETIRFDFSNSDKVIYKHEYKFSDGKKKELNLEYIRE